MVLLRRSVVLALVIAVALLTLAASALGSGRDVIDDYQANGRVVGCYSAADYREALQQLRPEEQVYEDAIEAIREASTTNIAREGEECEPSLSAPAEAVDEDSGSNMGLWLLLLGAVVVVALGAGLLARRGGRGDGQGGGDGAVEGDTSGGDSSGGDAG